MWSLSLPSHARMVGKIKKRREVREMKDHKKQQREMLDRIDKNVQSITIGDFIIGLIATGILLVSGFGWGSVVPALAGVAVLACYLLFLPKKDEEPLKASEGYTKIQLLQVIPMGVAGLYIFSSGASRLLGGDTRLSVWMISLAGLILLVYCSRVFLRFR